MKKLILFFLLAIPAFGQITVVGGDPNILLFPSTPTGTCTMPNLAQAQDSGAPYYCGPDFAWHAFGTGSGGGGGSGDFSSNTSTSVDGEFVLFSGGAGKTGKRASGSGIVKSASGVFGLAASGTDYAPATSGSTLLKPNGSGGFAAGIAADVIALFNSGSCVGFLKSDGTCGTAAAGMGDPGANGIMKRTSLNTSSVASSTDVTGLWSGTCNSGTFLRGDGSCQTPTGAGTVSANSTSNAKAFAVYSTNGGSTTVIADTAGFTDGAGNATVASLTTTTSNGGLDFTEGTGAGVTKAIAHGLLIEDSTSHRFKGCHNSASCTFSGIAEYQDKLNVFAATTSAELFGIISDETGSGALVGGTSPTISGHPTIEGVTSTGSTGTNKFVFDTGPTLVNPIVGTQSANDNSTKAASTAYTDAQVASGTATQTNKTFDAEGTGNTLTVPSKVWLAAAGCSNTTAASFWDLPTSTPAVAACVTGTNIQKGVLQYADTSGGFSAQNTILLPADFSGNIDARIIWRTSATSGNAKFSLSTACTDVAASATDDPSFNTASTVTTAAPGTTLQIQTSSITSLTKTGCVAGNLLHVKLFRDGNDGSDTLGASLDVIGVELTIRRAM
jgi:hypothetical protein